MSRTNDDRADHATRVPTSGARVVARDIARVFESKTGRVVACREVNLHADPGEFVVIVGPSGCGKSTMLRLLADLDSPTNGTLEVVGPGGRPPVNSMVFHGRTLFPWLSLRQNVAYGLQANGRGKHEALSVADELLDRVGLSEFSHAWPHQVSEGMRQRTSLARALAIDPELLLMDEPFGALDEQTRYLLQEELLRIWERSGKTVVFVTHSIEEALLLGDRVLVMTARPGTIADEIVVPFARPRSMSNIRQDPRYAQLFERIWGTLRAEVERGGAFA